MQQRAFLARSDGRFAQVGQAPSRARKVLAHGAEAIRDYASLDAGGIACMRPWAA
jgi:hypothetical protein